MECIGYIRGPMNSPADDGGHALSNVSIHCLHPNFAAASHRAPPQFDVEELVVESHPPDESERNVHATCHPVTLGDAQLVLGEVELPLSNQRAPLPSSQAFVEHFHVPTLF